MKTIKKIFSRIKSKSKGDSSSAELISFIVLIPLFLGVFVSIVDVSFYFSNRSLVESIASEGARNVSIFGGNGDANMATTIEKNYGDKLACSTSRPDLPTPELRSKFSEILGSEKHSDTECNVAAALAKQTGLVSVSFEDVKDAVKCGPYQTQHIGDNTFCKIHYEYKGVPMSPLSLFPATDDSGKSAFESNLVVKSSTAEVAKVTLVPRK